MSLRVLHILDHSIPLQSGYTFRTRSILLEQRRMGWETHHLTSPKHPAELLEEEVDGLKFHRTPWHSLFFGRLPGAREWSQIRATARRLEEIARRIRPHILHAHSPALNAVAALGVGRRLGIPVVYEVRAFWEDAAADHGTSPAWGMRYRLTRALETFALRRAAHVTTICEGLKADIVARGIPPERITVVPNAVNVNAFRFGVEPDEALRRNLALEGSLVIGFIGSFYAYEGLDLLLRALPEVLARLPHARVLLVGGGPHEPTLRALAKSLRVEDKVVFAGRVPHGEVPRYYSIVDVLAYPRHAMRLTELVTPLKPLEAMAQGRLVLASDVGGHRELIRDGETGTLFRAGDASSLAQSIVRLAETRERWPQLREQGRRFVERERTWSAAAARYRDVFGRLTEVAGMSLTGLRIALVGPLPPPEGGMANQTRQLAELLENEGARVTLVRMNAPYRPRWIGRIRGLRAFFRLVPYVLRLWRAADSTDLFHVLANSGWSWYFFAAPAIRIARLRGVPVVVNYRGGEADRFLRKAGEKVLGTLRSADALAVPSGFLRDVFARHGLASVVVPNVVDLERFRPGLPSLGAPRLIVARNLDPIYDNATALRAFAMIRQVIPDSRMTVAGTGPEEKTLRALAAKLGIAEAVDFCGRVPRERIAELYRSATVALNPSRVDNMPNSVLEAMASGIPVVSTDAGGVPYILRNEVSGLIVPMNDPEAMAEAALRVLQDRRFASHLRAAAFNDVQQYAWARVRERWAALYATVLPKLAMETRAA